jgi:hypothetical protein
VERPDAVVGAAEAGQLEAAPGLTPVAANQWCGVGQYRSYAWGAAGDPPVSYLLLLNNSIILQMCLSLCSPAAPWSNSLPPSPASGTIGRLFRLGDKHFMGSWCRGLTCLPVTEEIAGSNPVEPAMKKTSRQRGLFHDEGRSHVLQLLLVYCKVYQSSRWTVGYTTLVPHLSYLD